MKQYPNWEVHREGNNWDVFLNYFFAVLFLCCLIVGIFLNPFIIIYHSRQKKTFATILFLLVSSIDQFKSLYFPLVLIPKLLSPLEDDYFSGDLSSVSWTAHANRFFLPLGYFEMDLLVVLCVARYLSFVNPLSSARKRNLVFSTTLVLFFLHRMIYNLCEYLFVEPLIYMRNINVVVSQDSDFAMNVGIPVMYGESVFHCLFLLCGGVFSALTIRYLRSCDPASSAASTENIRRGIMSVIAMNVLNVFVLLSVIGHNIAVAVIKSKEWKKFSTGLDLIQFMDTYGTPLIQSTFNSLSFLLVCKSFRIFVKKLVLERRIGPENTNCTVVR